MDGSVITMTLQLEIATKQDGDQWLAWCPPIDVFSQGDAKAGAIASLKEAIDLWFESCIQRGVLDDALREAGFTRGKPSQQPSASGCVDDVGMKSAFKSGFTPDYIEVQIPAYTTA
jgi:predicted RNase H-like HicB family nuclease